MQATDQAADQAAAIPAADLIHSAFYKFVRVADADALAAQLRELSRDLLGSILVASEGINGMVAARPDALAAFEQALTTDARLHGLFSGMAFKHSACTTAPFQRMKVHRKPEVLALGVDGVEAVGHQGVQLKPQQWRELMQQDDVVLIDNRNHFEYRLGRFKSAVDPQVHNFRDFPAWVLAQLPTWKAQKKRVAMYCTGGIRCEKTSAWMSQFGMPVLELEGGVLNYFAQMPDAQNDWEGECFVFDNRVALDSRLQETGTRAEDIFGSAPDERWRLKRAQRLVSLTPSAVPLRSGRRNTAAPLPTKNGVGPSCIVLPRGPWPTIAAFLIERFPGVTPDEWQQRVQQGGVLDEQGAAVNASRRFVAGLKIFYHRHLDVEARIPFEAPVLFQDDLLVVADKPHFLPVTPGGKYLQETLLVRLKRSLGVDSLTPIHRLDRETAGVVMFCVDPKARAAYAAMFAQRRVVKRYEAIVAWSGDSVLPLTHHSRMEADDHFMRMREVGGAPNSETHLELIEVTGDTAHLRLSPVTGRKHQLRVHCAALGMPIVNDALYPVMRPERPGDFAQPLRLIARCVAFTDPVTGRPREFASSRCF